MHKKIIFLALFSITILSNNILLAQFNDYGIKGGLQGFGLLPDTDFPNEDVKPSYLARAFLRIKVFDLIDAELGVGYGLLAGDDPSNDLWETSIIPADVRFLLSPFKGSVVNPYGYLGAGYMKWKIEDKPNQQKYASPFKGVLEDDYEYIAPIGLGFEVKLSSSILLDISGGYNYIFTDDIDYFNTIDSPLKGDNDGYWNFGAGLIFVGESGSSDEDLDGLTLDQERQFKTDPKNPDTDNDGLIDGLEINQYTTDPLSADSDGDGISDNDEIRKYSTNPNSTDTDGDDVSDGDEINKYHTDALRIDSDFDGLADNIEITEIKTNPTNPDTDNDELKDGDEVNKYKTSPIKNDTDGDGLLDGEEIFKYNTNPTKADTDGGTTNDKEEVIRGTNPLNPEDDIILDISAPIVLEGVTFASGSAELTPEREKMLLRVLNTLNAYPDIKVEIRGYTDNVGKASSNKRLSQRRANAVRYWILNKGISPERVVANGYGEENPIADNSTKEGRRLNRRIEFVKTN